MVERLDYPAKHWRDRADEAYVLADRAATPELRESWLHVAESYEILAKAAQVMERSGVMVQGSEREAEGTRARFETG